MARRISVAMTQQQVIDRTLRQAIADIRKAVGA